MNKAKRKYFLDKRITEGLIIFSFIFWFYLIPTFAPGQQEGLILRFAIGILFVSAVSHYILLLMGRVKKMANLTLKEIPIVVILAYAAFIYLVEVLGFYVSSFLLLTFVMAYLGVNRKTMLFIPVFLIVIYFIFSQGLNIRFPQGIFF